MIGPTKDPAPRDAVDDWIDQACEADPLPPYVEEIEPERGPPLTRDECDAARMALGVWQAPEDFYPDDLGDALALGALAEVSPGRRLNILGSKAAFFRAELFGCCTSSRTPPASTTRSTPSSDSLSNRSTSVSRLVP